MARRLLVAVPGSVQHQGIQMSQLALEKTDNQRYATNTKNIIKPFA